MKSRALSVMLMTTLLLPSLGLAAVSYQDVLEVPALRSELAARTLLVGVTLAGQRIVAVGARGDIVYSDDQGQSWSQAAVPVSSDLVAVTFPTPQQGWAVGHDGVVLHSTDGGSSWNKQFDGRAAAQVMAEFYKSAVSAPAADGQEDAATAGLAEEIQRFEEQGADKPFLDVWFENESTGFIVGAFSLIFRTTDGGKSWTPWYDRIDNPARLHLYAIRPVGDALFITAEQGTLFRLSRTTGRFEAIKTPYSGTFFGITGKPGAVIAFGMRGNAFRSGDGAAWQKVETGVQDGLVGATLTGDGRIVLVSQGGHVLVSSDDGASFTQLGIEQSTPAAAVAALDGNTLALVGQRGVKLQAIK